MKNIRLLLPIVLFMLITGCNTETEKQVELVEGEKEKLSTDLNGDLELELSKQFDDSFPDATVYEKVMFDTDEDEQDDLIVIFDTPEKKSNFAVLTQKYLNAVSIGEGEGYYFEYIKDSIKVDEDKNSFVVTLEDKAKGLIVDYRITISYDASTNDTVFKIDTTDK